nr:UDP-2,3-diacylglucosamine diphosphatase [uncultured Holophaga sp.]
MPRVRTIFLSDLHLGTRACQAERLLDFLKVYPAENLFLLGDIVDFWAMQRSQQWDATHNTVIQKLLKRARQGERVMVIPGNHDEALRDYCGSDFGGIRLEREHVYEHPDGRRFLLVHGDEFDHVTLYHKWVALLGDASYNALVRVNLWISWIRRQLGMRGHWSLAGFAKRKVKRALEYLFEFEGHVLKAARGRGLDGVICGHVHWARVREEGGLLYMNCGDWVDSCTALVEHLDGRFEIIEWGRAVTEEVAA